MSTEYALSIIIVLFQCSPLERKHENMIMQMPEQFPESPWVSPSMVYSFHMTTFFQSSVHLR